MKSSTLSLDFALKVVTVGWLTVRENDIFGEAKPERSGGRSVKGNGSKGRGSSDGDESDDEYCGDKCGEIGGDKADLSNRLAFDSVSSTGVEISFRPLSRGCPIDVGSMYKLWKGVNRLSSSEWSSVAFASLEAIGQIDQRKKSSKAEIQMGECYSLSNCFILLRFRKGMSW